MGITYPSEDMQKLKKEVEKVINEILESETIKKLEKVIDIYDKSRDIFFEEKYKDWTIWLSIPEADPVEPAGISIIFMYLGKNILLHMDYVIREWEIEYPDEKIVLEKFIEDKDELMKILEELVKRAYVEIF